MSEIKVRVIEELVKVAELWRNESKFFRGHRCASWNLSPTISRYSYELTSEDSQAEGLMLLDFKNRALPFLSRLPESECDWLILARHHGLPTRIIDWTTNILVAAFFAVEGESEEDSVVFSISPDKYLYPGDHIDPWESKDDSKYVAIIPRHNVDRAIAQHSRMTLHYQPFEEFRPKDIKTIIIPRANRADILRELNGLGINRSVLFPGLDGLAEYIKKAYIKGFPT